MPIITSLFDTDLYKFTMSYFIWKHFPNEEAKFAFTCRNRDVNLLKVIDLSQLRQELAAVRNLRLSEDELYYLRQLGYFEDEAFFDFLRRLELPAVKVQIRRRKLDITLRGLWATATFWEIPILAIVNQLAAEGQMKTKGLTREDVWIEGERRLQAKTQLLKANPLLNDDGSVVADLAEFGTRRRWCLDWQRHVLTSTLREIPEQLAGTSNLMLARELGIKVIGTIAHEPIMGAGAIMGTTDEALLDAPMQVLNLWYKEFGKDLAIALTDTYGTPAFFRAFTPEMAHQFRGLRQDSGNPFELGETAIAFYDDLGIDPRTKVVVFSDGLTARTIVQLRQRFARRIGQPKGWGTHWTFDVGLDTYSIVFKLVSVNGRPAVKLSDDLAKAIGDPAEVERVKRVFGYTSTYRQEPTI